MIDWVNPGSCREIARTGVQALRFDEPPLKKRLLLISETDGWFVDRVNAATKCTVGHRTLHVEDYGRIAITFVDIQTSCAVRVALTLDIRKRDSAFASDDPVHCFAQRLQLSQFYEL